MTVGVSVFDEHISSFIQTRLIIVLQSQVIEFQWKDIQGYDIEEEGMAFTLEYNRPGKKPRPVQILTQYVSLFSVLSGMSD